MRRVWEWLRSFGRNTRMDLSLHDRLSRADDHELNRRLQQVDRHLSQLERELAIIVANMQHTNEPIDDDA